MKTITVGTTGVLTSIIAEQTLNQLNSVLTIAIQLIIAVITLVKLLKQNKNEK